MNEGFYINVLRIFKLIFKEVEAFVWKCEAFVKIKRLQEDFMNITRLFEATL
jgi:hypothetical protein